MAGNQRYAGTGWSRIQRLAGSVAANTQKDFCGVNNRKEVRDLRVEGKGGGEKEELVMRENPFAHENCWNTLEILGKARHFFLKRL